MHLGDRLKKARLGAGLTQPQLAEPHYTAAYVSTIEAGKRNPSRKALEHFATRLGLDPEWLSTGVDPGLPSELQAEYLEHRKAVSVGDAETIERAQEALNSLARRAAKHQLHELHAKARVAIGIAMENQGDLDGAIALYERVLADLREETPIARVDATASLARALQTRGRTSHAAFLIEKLLVELDLDGLNDPSSLVRLHTSLVAAYSDKGLIDKANESAETALSLAVQIDNPERVANMNLNVGIMLKNQGRWNAAAQHLAEAERWFVELGLELEKGRVQLARGLALREQEQFDDARTHLSRAVEVFKNAGAQALEARAVGALGILERLAGNLDKARFLLRGSLAIAGADKVTEGIALRELGLCDAEKRPRAVKQLREAISVLEEGGNVREAANTYRELGNLLSGYKEMETACDAYRRAADLFEQAA